MKFLRIKNAVGDKPAELYITGDIMDDSFKGWSWGDDMSTYPSDIREMLGGLSGQDLTVYINSGGGDVFAGMAIASMIERYQGKTTAVVDGLSASIATQIMFACDAVQIPSNAYIMIHKPSSVSIGDADDHRQTADLLDKLQDGIELRYQKWAQDGVTADQIKQMVNDATWLSGAEAADVFKIDSAAPLQAVASIGDYARRLQNRPAELKIRDVAPEKPEAIPKKLAPVPDGKEKLNDEITKINDEITIALALADVF